jgi:hypothetical protein
MKPLTCRALLCVVAMSVSVVASAIAQTAPSPNIEVANVKFNTVRANTGSWYEAEIELQPRGPQPTDNRNFINRVKVTFSLGINSVKAPPGSRIPDTFYRASAEAVAIETSGGKTVFRFYLPPEIVKRDQITGDQKFYLVEVFVDGKALPLSKDNVSNTMNSAALVEGFRNKVSSDAGMNDGIMVPQYLTPFANTGSPPPPSYIRLEPNR